MKKQQGFSIVEVFVAIGVGVILMTGVINIYLASKRTYQMNNEIINFQENSRYISSRLSEELRMAGHAGCFDANEKGLDFVDDDFSTGAVSFYQSSIQGFEYTSSSDAPYPAVPTGTTAPTVGALNPPAVSKSDVISVQYGSSYISPINANMATKSAALSVDANTSVLGEIEKGDIMVLADCRKAEVFVSTNDPASDSSINHANPFDKKYEQSEDGLWPTLMRFVSNTYYVGSDNVLYQRNNLTGQTSKLFDGITSMDISYGVRSGSQTRYMNATDIEAEGLMSNIIIIKIEYILQSLTKVETASGSDYTERSYVTTVVLRNQG